MSDQKVEQVQEWLLETYGSRSEFSNFVTSSGFQANGNTGNNTMTALVFALQYELGISQPSGNFGPTTINLSPKISLATAASYSENIVKILEGGLWCHGYSAGYSEPEIPLFGGVDFGGTYDTDTDLAVKQLQKDIGISQSGKFDGYLWKALLSTDAFVTTWTNGSAKIREAQQYLNALAINGYYFADDFVGGYLPTDGLNNRAFSKALILYIQAIQGIYASEATGNLGPSTQANLVNIPDGLPSDTTKSRHFVRAGVFALLANGYDLSINSYWSEETSSVVSQFQKDMALPVTGKIDLTTWMSLLVSHGNPNRPFSIIDTRFEITEERLAVIKNMGIKAVGRYINGTEFKVLRKNEAKRLINADIGLIPIYQQNALSSNDFSYEEGAEQGANAQKFAVDFGIPLNSTIYFAVDYDAQDWEISSYVIPYFKGVLSKCKIYQVGVYGTRNVCQRLADAGLTVSSYVSNMSSGFSGNLGFKMPSNWAFDQFNETRISDFDIDKVTASERAVYVKNLTPNLNVPENPSLPTEGYVLPDVNITSSYIDIDKVIELVKELENLYQSLYPNSSSQEVMINCLNAMRFSKYDGTKWNITLGIHNQDFLYYIKNNNVSLYDKIILLSGDTYLATDKNNGINAPIDVGHLCATLLGYQTTNFPKSWTGWVGDFSSAYSRIKFLVSQGVALQTACDNSVGSTDSSYNFTDFIADIDAVQLYNRIPLFEEVSTNNLLSNLLTSYYENTVEKYRYTYFMDVMVSSTGHSYSEVFRGIADTLVEDNVFYSILALNKEPNPDEEIVLALISSTAKYVIARSKL